MVRGLGLLVVGRGFHHLLSENPEGKSLEREVVWGVSGVVVERAASARATHNPT